MLYGLSLFFLSFLALPRFCHDDSQQKRGEKNGLADASDGLRAGDGALQANRGMLGDKNWGSSLQDQAVPCKACS